MGAGENEASGAQLPANDNGGDRSGNVRAAVLRLARLIGRQIAREEFEERDAANDNRLVPESREE